MVTLLTILHIVVCLFLMLTVLLQSGKGGGMGALGGGGGTTTVFGGSGASTFLRSLTAVAATVFMLASMTLAFIASHNAGDPLDKFGASQDDIRDQKDKEKERALAPGALGSGFAPKGSMTGSAAEAPVSVPQGASMGVPDPAGSGPQPTTGTTPILGSGYEPGPATAPVPTGAGAATVAPPRSGSTSSPTTTSTPAPKGDTPKAVTPKHADAPTVVTPKAVAPAAPSPEAPAAKTASPSPSPGAVTPTPATSGSAQ
jgi:preprotein translocase subunit SecG